MPLRESVSLLVPLGSSLASIPRLVPKFPSPRGYCGAAVSLERLMKSVPHGGMTSETQNWAPRADVSVAARHRSTSRHLVIDHQLPSVTGGGTMLLTFFLVVILAGVEH